jgi:hypothetical protein
MWKLTNGEDMVEWEEPEEEPEEEEPEEETEEEW